MINIWSYTQEHTMSRQLVSIIVYPNYTIVSNWSSARSCTLRLDWQLTRSGHVPHITLGNFVMYPKLHWVIGHIPQNKLYYNEKLVMYPTLDRAIALYPRTSFVGQLVGTRPCTPSQQRMINRKTKMPHFGLFIP